MKKSYLGILALALFGLGILSAFSEGEMTEEQREQLQEIEDRVMDRLDSFRMEKDKECYDRALGVAMIRVDSMMTANVKPGKPTTGKKGDPRPTKPTTPNTPAKDPQKDRSGATKSDDPASQKDRSGASQSGKIED